MEATFPFLATVPINKTRAELRQEEIDAWKEQHGVWTFHTSGMDEPWVAVCLPKAHEALSGYGLSPDELAKPIELFAGYCRLLDEAGLSASGETEAETCEQLAKQLDLPRP